MAPPLRISAVRVTICGSALIMPATAVPLRFPVPFSPDLAMAVVSVMVAAVPPPVITALVFSVGLVPGARRPFTPPVLPGRCMSVAVAFPLSSCAGASPQHSALESSPSHASCVILNKESQKVCAACHIQRGYTTHPVAWTHMLMYDGL